MDTGEVSTGAGGGWVAPTPLAWRGGAFAFPTTFVAPCRRLWRGPGFPTQGKGSAGKPELPLAAQPKCRAVALAAAPRPALQMYSLHVSAGMEEPSPEGTRERGPEET